MSLFKKLAEKIAGGSSANLERIRTDSERRRAAKSSGMLPKVTGDVIDDTISSLQQRISSNNYSGSIPKEPKGPKK